jgi:hypothetical protein
MTFIPDQFRSSHSIEGLKAVAKRFQTLVIMEPGTIPNLVGAGCGIGRYLGEFQDQLTLDEVSSNVKNQIAKYLPDDPLSDVEIKYAEDKRDGKSILILFFSLSTGEKFAMTTKVEGVNPDGMKILSEFYF